jgi:hypothetical protein
MESPTSNKKREPRKFKRRKRTHSNNKFYTSKSWRGLRAKYIQDLTNHQYEDIQHLDTHKVTYLLSQVPICETCYRLFKADAYTTVNRGTEVDHKEPVNPSNALDSKGWGAPLDVDNLQLLCHEHHTRKTNRDARTIIKKRNDNT